MVVWPPHRHTDAEEEDLGSFPPIAVEESSKMNCVRVIHSCIFLTDQYAEHPHPCTAGAGPKTIVRGVEKTLHDQDPAWRFHPARLPDVRDFDPNSIGVELSPSSSPRSAPTCRRRSVRGADHTVSSLTLIRFYRS